MDPGIGTVTRVTVETAAWPDAPQEVMAPGHVIEVVLTDSAAEAHAITVDCGTVESWELLVIPTEEPARVATRLLTAAADPANPLSAPGLPATPLLSITPAPVSTRSFLPGYNRVAS